MRALRVGVGPDIGLLDQRPNLLQRVDREVFWLAVLAIACGTVLVGYNEAASPVVLTLPLRGSHGIHLVDVVGGSLIALGTTVLLRSGRRR